MPHFSEKNISYEKRIYLLKADDYVKSKAMEKYREITSKSNSDNISKPQQYLDGLLSIPFGTALGIYGIWTLLKDETIELFNPKQGEVNEMS